MTRTFVKICGITNLDDANAAIGAGADALGFIAVPNTPRYVSPDTVREIVAALPSHVTTVVVAKTPGNANGYPCQMVQFYEEGGETDITRRVRVVRMQNADSLADLPALAEKTDALLLDTYHDTALGGVGKTFDWSLAIRAQEKLPGTRFLLAGGLTPENVADAVRTVRPFGVDVSSGVEAEPGRKNHAKVRAFIEAVRLADRDGTP